MIEPVEIPKYPGYKIFRNGSIIGPRGRALKMSTGINGYLYIRVHVSGKPTNVYVHRMVAAAYLGLDISNLDLPVDHVDRIRINNSVDNLEIVTHSENNFRKNAHLYGEDTLSHKKCKLCGKLKLRSQFYKNPAAADGLYYRCKSCAISVRNQRSYK